MLRLLQVVAASLQTALDLVLPRKARMVRTARYTSDTLPVSPLTQTYGGTSITSLLSYQDQAVEDCVRALKYDASAAAATILAEILAEYLREEIAQIRAFSTLPILLVPVPLHGRRFRERGFNQVALVLERLPKEFRNSELTTLSFGIIERIRETTPQTRLPRAERLENVRGAFALAETDAAQHSHIILIDDVTTTGATLFEASRPLERIHASFTLIALARA